MTEDARPPVGPSERLEAGAILGSLAIAVGSGIVGFALIAPALAFLWVAGIALLVALWLARGTPR